MDLRAEMLITEDVHLRAPQAELEKFQREQAYQAKKAALDFKRRQAKMPSIEGRDQRSARERAIDRVLEVA